MEQEVSKVSELQKLESGTQSDFKDLVYDENENIVVMDDQSSILFPKVHKNHFKDGGYGSLQDLQSVMPLHSVMPFSIPSTPRMNRNEFLQDSMKIVGQNELIPQRLVTEEDNKTIRRSKKKQYNTNPISNLNSPRSPLSSFKKDKSSCEDSGLEINEIMKPTINLENQAKTQYKPVKNSIVMQK